IVNRLAKQPVGTAPHAYEEPALQAEYEKWVVPELEIARDADVAVVRKCLSSGEDVTPLTEAHALAWVRALNQLRLAAGNLLHLSDDDWSSAASSEVRESEEFRMLLALSLLQEELVAALES